MEITAILTKDDLKMAIRLKLELEGFEVTSEPKFSSDGSVEVKVKKKPEPKYHNIDWR